MMDALHIILAIVGAFSFGVSVASYFLQKQIDQLKGIVNDRNKLIEEYIETETGKRLGEEGIKILNEELKEAAND